MKKIEMTSTKKLEPDSELSKKNSSGSANLQVVDFIEKSSWTDFQLMVEGKDLYIPKSFLALVSPVFRLMLESDFKEKDLDALPLPGKKYEDVLTFLKCTHPGKRLKVTYDIIPKVLPLAHEYQVQWLMDDCSSLMMMQMDTTLMFGVNTEIVEKYCSICAMAETYDLRSVMERCIEVISSIGYKFFKNLPQFNEISSGTRYRILHKRLDSIDKK